MGKRRKRVGEKEKVRANGEDRKRSEEILERMKKQERRKKIGRKTKRERQDDRERERESFKSGNNY